MRLQTLSSEGHRCGTHSFFLFLLSAVSAFLSDLSASPSSVLWLSAFHSLSPWGLAQRTGGTGASDKLHSPHQPQVALTSLSLPTCNTSPPTPHPLHFISVVIPQSPGLWGHPLVQGPKMEAVSEPGPQETHVFKAPLVLPG